MLRVMAIACYLLVSVSSLPLGSAGSQATAGAAAATSSLAGTSAPPTITPAGAKLAPAKRVNTSRLRLKASKKLQRKVSKARQHGKKHATRLSTKAPTSPPTPSKIARDGTATE